MNEYEVRLVEYTVHGLVEHKIRISSTCEMDALVVAQNKYDNSTPVEVKKIKTL